MGRGDKMVADGKKYCKSPGPNITSKKKKMKVNFISGRKSQGGTGAVCTIQCLNNNQLTTPPPTTTPPPPTTTAVSNTTVPLAIVLIGGKTWRELTDVEVVQPFTSGATSCPSLPDLDVGRRGRISFLLEGD